ncbi:hypothetical protein ACFX5U_09690 [Sphingobacterium sp. SG20118]
MKLITKSIDMPREGSNLLLISRTRFPDGEVVLGSVEPADP